MKCTCQRQRFGNQLTIWTVIVSAWYMHTYNSCVVFFSFVLALFFLVVLLYSVTVLTIQWLCTIHPLLLSLLLLSFETALFVCKVSRSMMCVCGCVRVRQRENSKRDKISCTIPAAIILSSSIRTDSIFSTRLHPKSKEKRSFIYTCVCCFCYLFQVIHHIYTRTYVWLCVSILYHKKVTELNRHWMVYAITKRSNFQ